MKAGEYILQVTREVYSSGTNVVVDVVHYKESKIDARFLGLEIQNVLPDNVLLEERAILDEDVSALEIRVLADKIADLLIIPHLGEALI